MRRSRGIRACLAAGALFAVPAAAREVIPPSRGDRAAVNEAVDAHLTRTRDAAIRDSWKKSPGDAEKALVAVWKAFVFPLKNRSIAAVELALENDRACAPGLDFGTLAGRERAAHPVFAPTLLIRAGDQDLSIGTDKFGHFFEEGFLCRQVAQAEPERGAALAEGVSRWLEGLEPDAASVAWIRRTRTIKAWWVDAEGKREYDLVVSFAAHAASASTGLPRRSSPADVAANLAGMEWYNDLAAILTRAPKDMKGLEDLLGKNPVRVAEFVTRAWDEEHNPNVETLEKAPGR